MPRSEARIAVSIWDDEDFLHLSVGAQRMFMFLLSQRDLAHTGAIALRYRRWTSKAKGLDVRAVVDALDELVAGRFIVMDEDAEELLIRSFIRRDKVYRQPNVLRSAADQLDTISSPLLLAALAEELRRVATAEDIKDDAAGIVADMLAAIGDAKPNPTPNPSGRGSRTPSETPPEAPSDESPAAPSVEPLEKAKSDGGHSEGAFRQIGLAPVHEGSENPSGEATGGTPGVRGDVTTLRRSPNPDLRTPIPEPQELPPLRGGALRLVDDSLPIEGELLDAGTVAIAQPQNAQSVLGDWIDYAARSAVALTKSLKGRYGRAIKALLDAGYTADEIKIALAKLLAEGNVGRPNYLEDRVVKARQTGAVGRRLTPGERSVVKLSGPGGIDLMAHFFGAEEAS